MYEVDDLDKVVALESVPNPDIGAPLPFLVCREGCAVLAYLTYEPDPQWDGTYATVVGPESGGRPVAVVQFKGTYAHMFGPPNDEAFNGHPLAQRGLTPYSAFEIQQSSWLRRLERMNSVHRRHDKEWFFTGRRHFVFAFHDSTFECIASGFSIELVRGSLHSILPRMLELLR